MTPDQVRSLVKKLPVKEQQKVYELLAKIEETKALEAARSSFLGFVRYMWPQFIEGEHHRIMAEEFDAALDGRGARVTISMPPRFGKSSLTSIYLPAYFLGRFPDRKIIQTSHTAELAIGFGRQVRNMIDSKDFQTVFPGVSLAQDSKASGRWNTNKGGEYFAIGVGGAVSGKGADLFLIDDPHAEQDAVIAQNDPTVYDKVTEWYESGPRQRLQPGGRIFIIATRWSLRDLIGQLRKKQMNDPRADRWKPIEIPALIENPETKEMESSWPGFWTTEDLLATKASIPVSKWNAQYMQNPTAEEGALIKREWWQHWEGDKPHYEAIIQAWDTAFTSKTGSDYSACTTWGVFYQQMNGKRTPCLMLIDMLRGKWEFPELKKEALAHYKEHKPGIMLIEARSSGHSLIQEFRAMGIPVQSFEVGRGTKYLANDKVSRLNSVTDIFASGFVFCNKYTTFAQETIEECAAFPAGENDDVVDTVCMALMRFRQGGWIGTAQDYEEEEEIYARRRRAYY